MFDFATCIAAFKNVEKPSWVFLYCNKMKLKLPQLCKLIVGPQKVTQCLQFFFALNSMFAHVQL